MRNAPNLFKLYQRHQTMKGYKTERESNLDGEFGGFDDEVLFKLEDGSYWIQAEYKYWYHYAYCPKAVILTSNGRYYIQIDDQDEIVEVHQISDIIESRIEGEFTGWQGESEYRLTNGQVWKQSAYKYKYKYSNRPEVIIYNTY